MADPSFGTVTHLTFHPTKNSGVHEEQKSPDANANGDRVIQIPLPHGIGVRSMCHAAACQVVLLAALLVGVDVTVALAVCVEVGVRIGRFWPTDTACAATDWHASIPARCFSTVVMRAGGTLRFWAAMPAAIARRLPDVVFVVGPLDVYTVF